jgi:hypothetical protein
MGAVGRAYIRFAVEEPQLFDTAFTPCAAPPPGPDEPSSWQVLLDCVAEMEATGLVTAAMAVDAPLIAWAGVHGLATILVRGVTAEPMASDAAIDTVVEALLRSVETTPR